MTQEEIKFFDNLAGIWDDNEVLSTPEKVRDILGKVGIEAGDRVLDLGTGTGVLVPFLSETVGEKGKVVGIDISEGMLRQAVKKFGHLPNVAFKKMDFEKDTPEGKYNVIMLYCVYPHLHEPEKTLRRLKERNLAEGGRIVIAFPTDENFINGIHRERKAESALLASAPRLAAEIESWGFETRVLGYSPGEFIVSLEAAP